VEQPTVEIIQPKQNAFIPGIGVIVIEALASHPNGIERVEFRAGGNLLGIDNSPPYQQPWRVEGLSGPATIVISAYRALTPGAPGVDSVRVNVEGVTRL
ncbi:Ig-like domain-containing protein, partial [candidate division KSB1 bacterium]|nr:Ig-like domain-containing protein [candidate division KSB1 bacterium]